MEDLAAVKSVLFVCLGNICRSPMAEGIFRSVVLEHPTLSELVVDSAGTGNWHVGDPPDPRAQATSHNFGIDISMQKARQIQVGDFEVFDLIVGMDQSNVANLRRMASLDQAVKIHLFMELALGQILDVPDPYYHHEDGFNSVYEMLRDGSQSLSAKLLAGRV